MRALNTYFSRISSTLKSSLTGRRFSLKFENIIFMPLRHGSTLLLLPLHANTRGNLTDFAPSKAEFLQWLGEPELSLNFGSVTRTLKKKVRSTPTQQDLDFVADALRLNPHAAVAALGHRLLLRGPETESKCRPAFLPHLADPDVKRHRTLMTIAVEDPALLPDLFTFEMAEISNREAVTPVEKTDLVRPSARPKERSVVFINNCYYNFYYLARALRARGWDAVSVSLNNPTDAVNRLFHGEDINLFHADPVQFQRNLLDFYRTVRDRFGMVHFYGKGTLSLFPASQDSTPSHDGIPWDLLDWKRNGILVGYSHSGCLDGVSQTSFRHWNRNIMCNRCIFRNNADVCSDQRNLAWGWKLSTLADLICVETDPPLDFKNSEKSFLGPLTFALDPEVWRPDLEPPARYRLEQTGKIRIYHAVGNYRARTRDGVNVKGTGPVLAAIEKLESEGFPVELVFAENVPSIDNRFVQVQADIIVDQLNYGRYGALAREGMMLGKPVVGRLDKIDLADREATRCILESPIVSADEATIYDVLKDLVTDPQRRAEIGAASRAHALRWWSSDVLAKRYERVHDILRSGGSVPLDLDPDI